MLWGTQNLGVIGLLGAFAVGLISYSMDSSLEMAVASTVLAGVVIKFILPYVQRKWVEQYQNMDPKAVVAQIEGMKKEYAGRTEPAHLPTIEKFSGMGLQLLEGFADGATAGTSAPITGATPAGATGTPAVPGQMVQGAAGMPGVPAMTTPATTTTGVGGAQQQPQMQTAGVGAAVFTPNINTSGATAMTVPGTAPMPAQGMVAPAGGMTASQPAPAMTTAMAPAATPSSVIPGTASMAAPVGQAVPSTLQNVGQVAGAGTGAPQLAPAAPAPQVTANTLNAALGTQPTVPGGAIAGIPGAGAATGATTGGATAAGFRNIEKFAEQPQEIPGMFKLGELPSESKDGPHIDAGTTIMRSLGALNPGQIEALTNDTRTLLDTQKSLMGMLTTMKPMLSDGQNLLASFNSMFGSK